MVKEFILDNKLLIYPNAVARYDGKEIEQEITDEDFELISNGDIVTFIAVCHLNPDRTIVAHDALDKVLVVSTTALTPVEIEDGLKLRP